MKPRIDFIYIDSGGGHRAAASALHEVIAQQGREWDIRLLSIQDLLAPIDFIRKTTGIEFEEVYNIILRKGWSAITGPLVPVAHALIKASHRSQVAELVKFWKSQPPSMVVSLIPHYNRAMFQALAKVNPSAPYVTILTDVADYPPHFWIERQRQYLVCGSDKAVQQARKLGYRNEQIRQASGLIVNPKFYSAPVAGRSAERKKLGLEADRPTGIVLFGGEGSRAIPKIAAAIDTAEIGTQLIVICGRHTQAADDVRKMNRRVPIWVEGFTKELPYFMGLSDYLIGKPGPGCMSEAFLMKLPVIVERNASTLPQERYNTEWVEELGAGIVVRHFAQIAQAVRELLEPERLAHCRQAVARLHNRAVFEIPDMLAGILEAGVSSVRQPGAAAG